MAYDKQVIVQLGFDATIAGNALFLHTNSTIPSALIPVHPSTGAGVSKFRYADVRALTTAFSNLTPASRVYLQGHGDWVGQKLESYGAEDIAMLLATAKMPSVRIVSVLGCQLARDRGTYNDASTAVAGPGTDRLTTQANSFASELHAALKRRGITSDLYARVFNVGVATMHGGKKMTFGHDFDNTTWQIGRQYAKVVFSWSGQTQVRKWEYSPTRDI